MRLMKVFLTLFSIWLLQPGCKPSVVHGSSHYAVVMDAGSSGTRVYIYEIEKSSSKNLVTIPNAIKLASCKDPSPECKNSSKDTGIAALVNAGQEQIDAYLKPLIDFAKTKVPSNEISNSKIYLRSTAGVRNLSSRESQDRLMAMATRTLEKSGFISGKAMTIDGTMEGIYAWVTVNNIIGRLGTNAAPYGIVEMGGASEQITFATSEKINNAKMYEFQLDLGGITYLIYSYSYSHLGINEALKIDLPACDVTSNGSINYNQCKNAWIIHLDQGNFCRPFCALYDVSQPSIYGPFLLLGALSGILNGCGFSSPLTPLAIDALGEKYCPLVAKSYNTDYSKYEASEEQKSLCPNLDSDKYYATACKALALFSSELSGNGKNFIGYGFPADTNAVFLTDEHGNITAPDGSSHELTWTKGFIILEALSGVIQKST